MKPISPFGLPVGLSIAFWGLIGLVRYLSEKYFKSKKKSGLKYKKSDIAVILPAHNEELVIRSSIQALKQSLDSSQIYVISDGSSDKTVRRSIMEKCHASSLKLGRGKAKAITYGIKKYRLFERYKFVMTVDADTKIDKYFFKNALPLFRDRKVGVVFGTPKIHWEHHIIPRFSYYLIAYRERLEQTLKYFIIYGQTWKYTNVLGVIPGFTALYRSDILKQLEIDTPGILIEDFHLAFQLHKKKLGRIGYHPSMFGWDQHPHTLSDYWNQVKRWNIGFFQTVRKNGIWPSFFWLSLGVFSAEVILNSIFFFVTPFLLLLFIPIDIIPVGEIRSSLMMLQAFTIIGEINILESVLVLLAIDYLLTAILGILHKKPEFLFYGLFFIFMHIITSIILVSSIIPGFFGKSQGKWTSPTRRSEN